jgi:hypothetical protein
MAAGSLPVVWRQVSFWALGEALKTQAGILLAAQARTAADVKTRRTLRPLSEYDVPRRRF